MLKSGKLKEERNLPDVNTIIFLLEDLYNLEWNKTVFVIVKKFKKTTYFETSNTCY